MPAAATPAGAQGADRARRRDLGAFYTPEHAVAYMCGLLRDVDATSRFLEPSGGDGAFVAGLLRHAGVGPTQVEVWDVDPAVEPDMAAAGVSFTCRDSLLGPAATRRFTHVIGNPPYLNKQSAYLKAHRDQLRARYAHIGANDTYALFIAMALDHLQPGGQLVFLVSDTFLTLGIHRKLRHLLLTETQVDSITLLPAATFPDASVHTAVLAVTRQTAPDGHHVLFRDLRARMAGDYAGGRDHQVPQAELAGNPGHVFAYAPEDREVLTVSGRCPLRMLDLLDGGLGLYTRDNRRFLRVVDHPASGPLLTPPKGQDPLPAEEVGAGPDAAWRYLHKRGGDVRWWRPAEHAIAWDSDSRAQYGIPASVHVAETGVRRRGLVVSGVASRLSARLMTPGALWESNKAFGLFPKDPSRPPELFVAVLNSAWYTAAARALNHTVSLQIRDLAALPWLRFTDEEEAELGELGKEAVAHARTWGHTVEPPQQARIDEIVACAAARTLTVP